MMNDLAISQPQPLPLVIPFEDLLDADEAAKTIEWRAGDLDCAKTQAMPAMTLRDAKRYLRATGRSFRTNVVLSMALLTGVLAAILAAHV